MSARAGRQAAGSPPARAAVVLVCAIVAAGALSAEEFGAPIVLRAPAPEIDRGFGASVAVSDNALAVGVPNSPEGGVVYVYERRPGTAQGWRLAQVVSGVNPSTYEDFGAAVALDGDTLVAGAPYEESRDYAAGCSYVFYRARGGATNWGRVRTLVPQGLEERSYLGRSVAASAGRLAAGAPGAEAVYVHRRDLPIRSWWGVEEMIANPRQGVGVGFTFYFGYEVALSGRTLAVGGWQDRKYSPSASNLTLFDLVEDDDEEAASWLQIVHREAPTPLGSDWEREWARRLSLDGDLLVAGGSDQPSCAARVFVRNRNGRNRWGLSTRLRDPAVDLQVVSDVAVRGRTAAVSAAFRPADPPEYAFGALVFERHVPTNYSWSPVARLSNPEVTEPAESVAIGPREVVIGHPSAGLVQVFPRAPIVAADFENGDTSGLSWATGNVEVVSPGLAETGFGLEVAVDGTTKRSMVRARHPHREPTVSLTFHLAANRVSLGGQRVELMNLYGPTRDLVRLSLEEEPERDQYWLWLSAWEEGGANWREIGKTRLPPLRGVRIEVDWRASSGPGHDSGRVRLLVDGRLRLQTADLDTELQVVNGLLMGLPGGSWGTAGGAFLIDEIELHR